MFKRLSLVAIIAVSVGAFSGCASVPMVQGAQSAQVKAFNPPPQGEAGLYIYRDSSFGAALKKDIWVDGKCIGQSAPKVFFYTTVTGDTEHTISTESEFSPNDLKLYTKSGINYFVRQAIKMGVFVGGAKLEVVEDTKGEAAVKGLGEAVAGTGAK